MKAQNDPTHYYWKHKDGADPNRLIQSTSGKNDNGSWVPFKTRGQRDSEQRRQIARGMSMFFVFVFTAPFAVEPIIAGVTFLPSGVNTAANFVSANAINATTRALLLWYRWAPYLGVMGRSVAEFLDESGSAGMSNAARWAKLSLDEQMVAKALLESGRKLEILAPSSTQKTADFIVDGVSTELKTLTSEVFNENTAVTKIVEAFDQGKAVILNARQYDLSIDQMKSLIERVVGSLNSKGKELSGTIEIWTQSGQYKF